MAVTGICFGTFVLPRVISSPTTAALFAIHCVGDPPDGLVHCFGGYFHPKESRW